VPGSDRLLLSNGATFANLTGATFDILTAAIFTSRGGNPSSISNEGTLRMSVEGTTRIVGGVVFNNTGLLDVQAGTFEILGGGSVPGTFHVATDATLVFGGTFTETAQFEDSGGLIRLGNAALTAEGTISQLVSSGALTVVGDIMVATASLASGTLRVSSTATATFGALTLEGNNGQLQADGNVEIANFTMEPASNLLGSGTVTVTNTLTWAGGGMSGSGRTISQGTLEISGDVDRDLRDGRRLENLGTGTWSVLPAVPGDGRLLLSNGATFANLTGATFDIQTAAPFTSRGGNPSSISNEGTLRMRAEGTTSVLSGIAFSNAGKLVIDAGLTLNVVSFSQSAAGTTEVRILGPASDEQGRLATTSAALDGMLDVVAADGYMPNVGTMFDPVTYTTRSGEFATIEGHGVQYAATYGANSLSLTVVAPSAVQPFPASPAGDFNGSGTVEQGDLDLVLVHWDQAASSTPDSWLTNRPSGQIDQDDLDAVLLNWGATSRAPAASIAPPLPFAVRETARSSSSFAPLPNLPNPLPAHARDSAFAAFPPLALAHLLAPSLK
jgi:hypothetical protein